MRWRLMRLIPVLNESGPDVTRSAYGRLAGEIVLIPTAFRHAAWSRGEHAPDQAERPAGRILPGRDHRRGFQLRRHR
jgi:hypothetical protein